MHLNRPTMPTIAMVMFWCTAYVTFLVKSVLYAVLPKYPKDDEKTRWINMKILSIFQHKDHCGSIQGLDH
jgi:hypothetical protein